MKYLNDYRKIISHAKNLTLLKILFLEQFITDLTEN